MPLGRDLNGASCHPSNIATPQAAVQTYPRLTYPWTSHKNSISPEKLAFIDSFPQDNLVKVWCPKQGDDIFPCCKFEISQISVVSLKIWRTVEFAIGLYLEIEICKLSIFNNISKINYYFFKKLTWNSYFKTWTCYLLTKKIQGCLSQTIHNTFPPTQRIRCIEFILGENFFFKKQRHISHTFCLQSTYKIGRREKTSKNGTFCNVKYMKYFIKYKMRLRWITVLKWVMIRSKRCQKDGKAWQWRSTGVMPERKQGPEWQIRAILGDHGRINMSHKKEIGRGSWDGPHELG